MIRATSAQAGYFILQKNYLATQKAANINQLVGDIVGLPADTLTTAILAARARLEKFRPDQLLTGLDQDHTLLRSMLMHDSSYIVLAEQYPVLHAATVRQRNQAFNANFRLWGIETNEEMERLGEAILAALGDQILPGEAIAGQLPLAVVQELTQTSRGGRVTKTTNVALALQWLAARGLLYASNSSLDWRVEQPSYARLRRWYPDLDLAAAPGEAEAQKLLVRNYLAAFGPATEADISFWTGLGKSETARAINALSRETTLAMVEGIPGMLLMLKSQTDGLKAAAAPAEPSINVLPADDPFTTAHRASRSRYFTDPNWQRRIFSSTGAAKPTILVNDKIGGVWEWQMAEGRDQLVWQLLAKVDPPLEQAIRVEMEQVAAFIGPQATASQKLE